MQQFEVDAGGRTRKISVAKTGDRFVVTVDGQTRTMDVMRSGAHTLSLVDDSGRGYEVVIAADPGSPSRFTVRVDGAPVTVTVNGRRRWGRRDDHAATASGPQRVIAPMPGKIVRVLVKTGDAVHARQPLVVVEAMKMENELRAARDGTVAEVHAREGQSVDAGALLVLVQ